MKTMRTTLLATLFAFSFLTGCEMIRQNYSSEKEPMLVTAGFVAHPADTAKKKADLASLTPYKIQLRTYKGKSMYLYGDPKHGMIYVGGPAAYATYKKAAIQADIQAQEYANEVEWQYWTSTYGEDHAGNPSVF